ncbi:MAG: undecaprenyl-diphosphate phosphatase [Acidimicrobiia bacterium]
MRTTRGPRLRGLRMVAVALGMILVVGFVVAAHSARANAGDGSTTATAADEFTVPEAIVLGVVEGITEYLPISSTGHLTVTEQLLDVGQTDATRDVTKSYTVIIQIGAIFAVIGLYWRRLREMLQGIAGRNPTGRRTFFALVLAFIPAAVFGVVFGDTIQEHLFGAGPVAAAWIVGGFAILVFVRLFRSPQDAGLRLEEMSGRQALIIGLAQAVALWPGVSRSLVTIVAALIVGLTLSAAVEFSFLLGLATLSAASLYEVVRHGSEVIDTFGWVSPIVGILAAFVAAVIAIKWLVDYLNHHDLSIFGYYRIVVGVAVLVLLATNTI